MIKRKRIKKILCFLEQGDKKAARMLVNDAAESGAITLDEKDGCLADIDAYDPHNESEDKVLVSKYFSCYKGRRVIRLYSDFLTSAGVSRKTILLNYKSKPGAYGRAAVKHEYGHTVQAGKMCRAVFYSSVFVASPLYLLLTMISRKNGWLSRNYYNMPWERSADMFGGIDPKNDVARSRNYAAWSEKLCRRYIRIRQIISRVFTLGIKKYD